MSEDSLPQWLQWLFAGLPMIRANLPLFAVIVVLIVGAFWFMFGWGYGRVIASKDSQIELQDRQLADHKQKLDGASPDQKHALIRLKVGWRNWSQGGLPKRSVPSLYRAFAH